MRVVLDTNVLLAAVFGRGVCEALVDRLITDVEHHILCSEYILDEFREKAVQKFGAPDEQVRHAVRFFRTHFEMIVPAILPAETIQDASDLPVLGTAVAGQTDVLVTGDRQLQALGQITSATILSPRELYDRLIKPD